MDNQPRRVQRRWLYIPFAVAAAIVFAYFLLWRAGAGELKQGVEDWRETQMRAGWSVEYEGMKARGFPFFLRMRIDNPAIATPEGASWRGEALYVDALPYQLDRLIISPAGEQSFVEPSALGAWRVRADDWRASIAQDESRGWIFSMNMSAVSAQRDGAPEERATLESLVLDLSPARDDVHTLVLSLAAKDGALDLEDNRFELATLQTVAALSQIHLLSSPNPAASWRAGGGTLTLTGLFAEIEDSKISAAGALELDRRSYPAGRIDVELRKPAGIIALIGRTGALSPDETHAAAAGLMLMEIAGGGKIAAPIDFKNGEAQIKGVKLAELAPLE